jgi:hypothetical protein
MSRLLLLLGIALSAAPLVGNTIIVTGSSSESILFDGVQYRLRADWFTAGSGTGFVNGIASDNTTTTGIQYAGYVIPTGSTFNSATLNFSGAFGAANLTSAVVSAPNSFVISPTFTDTLSNYSVSISSALAGTAVVNSRTGTYNLLPLFKNDLLANHPITIRWTATDTFARVSGTILCLGSCDETFRLSDLRTFSASTSANILTLNFEPPPPPPPHPTPEPATMVLTGAALLGFGLMLRKTNHT